jgi:hypothetical protein
MNVGCTGESASDGRRLFYDDKLQSLMIRRIITSDTNYTDDNDVTIDQRATTVIELYR